MKSSDAKTALEAAILLCQQDDPILSEVVAAYPHTIQLVKRTILGLLAGTDSEIGSRFLFKLLEEANNTREVQYITLCLAKSDFPIFAIVFFALPTASIRYRFRLQTLLRMKGLQYAKPFLLALPSIPDIEFFEDTYGIDEIREIEKEKSR